MAGYHIKRVAIKKGRTSGAAKRQGIPQSHETTVNAPHSHGKAHKITHNKTV